MKWILFLSIILFSSAARSQDNTWLTHWDKYSKMKSIRAKFKQEKFLPSMDLTLSSKGTLYFNKPDLLEWTVTSGKPIKFTIDKDKVTLFEGKTKKSEMSLSKVGKAMVGPILHLRGWIKMDVDFVQKNYDVKNIGKRLFRFTPKDENTFFKKIEIKLGLSDPISKLILFETSGDRLSFEFEESKITYER